MDKIGFFHQVSSLNDIESTLHAKHATYLELLPLLEGETSLADLLAPAAPLVRVAHHRVLVSVRVEARVDVHGEVRLAGADVHAKAATTREQVALKEFFKKGFTVFKII